MYTYLVSLVTDHLITYIYHVGHLVSEQLLANRFATLLTLPLIKNWPLDCPLDCV